MKCTCARFLPSSFDVMDKSLSVASFVSQNLPMSCAVDKRENSGNGITDVSASYRFEP